MKNDPIVGHPHEKKTRKKCRVYKDHYKKYLVRYLLRIQGRTNDCPSFSDSCFLSFGVNAFRRTKGAPQHEMVARGMGSPSTRRFVRSAKPRMARVVYFHVWFLAGKLRQESSASVVRTEASRSTVSAWDSVTDCMLYYKCITFYKCTSHSSRALYLEVSSISRV